jgi:hypothetical protein
MTMVLAVTRQDLGRMFRADDPVDDPSGRSGRILREETAFTRSADHAIVCPQPRAVDNAAELDLSLAWAGDARGGSSRLAFEFAFLQVGMSTR